MRVSLFLTCLLVASSAQASCWESAGQRFDIDPILLKAIAWKESRGRTNAVGPLLRDGNRAHGALQINSIHLPELKRFGIGLKDLYDACVSQEVGAWVLAKCIRQFGKTWKAVGCYYAGPASRATAAQEEYVRDVQKFYEGYRLKEQQRQTQVASTSE